MYHARIRCAAMIKRREEGTACARSHDSLNNPNNPSEEMKLNLQIRRMSLRPAEIYARRKNLFRSLRGSLRCRLGEAHKFLNILDTAPSESTL